jgi:hypothetical protein
VPLKIDNELNQLRQDMSASDSFDHARFAEHLRVLRAKL